MIAGTAATPGAASSDQDYLIRGTAACRGASAYSDGSESFDEHQPIVGHPGVHLLQPDTPTRAPGRRGDDHHAASAHLRLHRPATPYVPYCTYYLLYLSGAEYKYSHDEGGESFAFQIVASWPRLIRTAVHTAGVARSPQQSAVTLYLIQVNTASVQDPTRPIELVLDIVNVLDAPRACRRHSRAASF